MGESLKDRFRGCLIGLAVGDALGVPIEFMHPGTFEPVTDFRSGGPHGLEAGEWSDDTSLTLCLAESLIEKKEFDPADQLERYMRWYREGHLSITGSCFDIGNTTREAIHKFEETGKHYCGPKDEYSCGNGSLMRLAPVPMFYHRDPIKAIEKSGDSSRTTHGHQKVIDACKYMGGIICGAVNGVSKEELLSKRYSPVEGYFDENPLDPEIDEVASGSFKDREPPKIRGRGYVVKSLEAALWAFYKSKDFEEGCLMAVNLGEDADTTGAIYGYIAGAYYGESGILGKWRDGLAEFELIDSFVEELYEISRNSV